MARPAAGDGGSGPATPAASNGTTQAGALQIVAKELWQATGPGGPLDDEPAAASDEPAPQASGKRTGRAHRRPSGHHQEAAP